MGFFNFKSDNTTVLFHNITDKSFFNNLFSVTNNIFNNFSINYLQIYYDNLFTYNNSYYIYSLLNVNNFYNLSFLVFIKIIFKLNILLFILYTIFFITYLENYIKQLMYLNNLVRLFILNESEKEVGPMDDFFFFAILFLLTISSFIIGSLFIILWQSNIFIWIFGSLLLVSILILTVPVNLFLDFGIAFFVYIRGSSSSSTLIKELLFDIISTATVFIRFVIQNIRFLFIFSAIFELLEWVYGNNSNLFLLNYSINNNIFINFTFQEYFYSSKNLNLMIINSILFIIFYLYYFLHLLFLLLVQITIYIGISVWLFFFLYSIKFLGKYEKYFIYKKN